MRLVIMSEQTNILVNEPLSWHSHIEQNFSLKPLEYDGQRMV